ncbi:alanine--tRNA ligase [Candidatus Pacearchaeota archaeon CG10_big_fil_rev_8_21_14_0_10_32_42]|nr:MAG: alanine--tRNA ligase [Candidatus Pacearchaeota archaeon CG10_big_fil_rev_8_21_14_0_10_32_42]
MDRNLLIKEYLEFFKKKDHKIIPGSSLIPTNDPTVLFTTAGMHPLIQFLNEQKHPLGKRLVNVQKCIRTVDIDEVGDTHHHTFFEMLGNWSLGDYFKNEAIEFSFEFLTKILKIPKENLAVSVFEGDENAPKDEESANKWFSLGISKERIAYLPKKNNWWGPAGLTGPCGPDTEIFYWKLKNKKAPKKFNPEDENWVEIWNNVLMQYTKNKTEEYLEAKQKNIDTGMGVERTVAILNGFEDNYLEEMWKPIIEKIENLSGKKYNGNEKIMRIIADHIKAAVFIISEGVLPSNTEQGYVLRRLIRKAIRYGKNIGIKKFTYEIAKPVFDIYTDYTLNKNLVKKELEKEEEKFNLTLEKGLKFLSKMAEGKKLISGKDAFLLYQSYGFPIEMTTELAKEKGMSINLEEFEQELKEHQKLSQTASSGKFKSGLSDNSEKTTPLHTATHLLNEALRQVLKDKKIAQKGSNITSERLRFDFNFDRKLTGEEKEKIENWINEKIEKKLIVKMEEMPLNKAIESGAQSEFGAKYPEIVSVYTIYNKKNPESFISKEICTGPHIKKTSELGKFKIIKEESVAAGIRRIKAILED